jgi:hypothetical protein
MFEIEVGPETIFALTVPGIPPLETLRQAGVKASWQPEGLLVVGQGSVNKAVKALRAVITKRSDDLSTGIIRLKLLIGPKAEEIIAEHDQGEHVLPMLTDEGFEKLADAHVEYSLSEYGVVFQGKEMRDKALRALGTDPDEVDFLYVVDIDD